MERTRVNIYLTDLHRKRLKVVAAATGKTQGEFVEELVDAKYLKYLEAVDTSKTGGKGSS